MAQKGKLMNLYRLSRHEVREAVAQTLDVAPDDIPEDENLVLLGLGSLEMMSLMNQWRRNGVDIDFRELVANPTLSSWWSYLAPESLDPR
jgi:aryl carrier-like protein